MRNQVISMFKLLIACIALLLLVTASTKAQKPQSRTETVYVDGVKSEVITRSSSQINSKPTFSVCAITTVPRLVDSGFPFNGKLLQFKSMASKREWVKYEVSSTVDFSDIVTLADVMIVTLKKENGEIVQYENPKIIKPEEGDMFTVMLAKNVGCGCEGK